MGDAKRRKLAGTYPKPEGATVSFFNVATGQAATARAAGDPLVWRKQWAANAKAEACNEPLPHPVPCNGCTECCYHAGVDVNPETEPAENLAHLDLVWREDEQGWFLRKRADGACVHLGPKGCTVYAHRPRACRLYDCRIHALGTVLDQFDGGHVQPTWMFQPNSNESRAFLAVCGILGQSRFFQSQRDGAPLSAAEVAKYILTHPKFGEFADGMLELVNADPETQKRMLGFDPRSITPQKITEGYQRAMMATQSKSAPKSAAD
jgi:hypothetical protein